MESKVPWKMANSRLGAETSKKLLEHISESKGLRLLRLYQSLKSQVEGPHRPKMGHCEQQEEQ